MGDIITLTAKEKFIDHNFAINQEHEVVVSDFVETKKILELSGLIQYGYSEKYRESYRLGEITFDFDTYPGIPEYVEVEAQTMELVQEGVELLGHIMSDTVNLTE